MAEENIRLQQTNFCISPLLGTFATVDTTDTLARLMFKNTSGDTTLSYSFNPNINKDTVINYLDYIGPRGQTSLENGMVFFTMESTASQVTINKWDLNVSNTRLDLDYTITKSTSGNEVIDSTNMAVGRYYTNLTNTTVTGTSRIVVDNTDNIVSGTRMYVGPSSNTSYLNDYEEVIATSVSGTTVNIESVNGTPLFSYFNAGDPVTYLGDIYLFCDTGYGNNQSKGSLYVLDNHSGATLRRHDSALYNSIEASNYGIPYYGTVAIVKNTQLLYINISDFTLKRSSRINITKPSSHAFLNVFALAFTLDTIYRLQSAKIIRQDDGSYLDISWSTYNYHEDSIPRYVDSVTLSTYPRSILHNQEVTTLVAQVRDQYGVAMSGKIVHFDKDYGDSNGVWGEINQEGTTDINGICTITYTSGWFDDSLAIDVNEDIKFTAYTDGSNVLTGSIYVYTYMILLLKPVFIFGENNNVLGSRLITQKENTFSSLSYLTQIYQLSTEFEMLGYSFFSMPGGHEYYSTHVTANVSIVEQWDKFESVTTFEQWKDFDSSLLVVQEKLAEGAFPVSQTLISRHLPAGSNEDDVDIAQFKFIIDAIPVPFSEKNNVNSTIWIKLSPYGFDLNKNTLIFKVRELSYVGDSGYVNYENTSNVVVTEYDAGGGLLGLEVLYTPTIYFHNGAIVYVYLEVYDNGIPANRIEFDYWFTVVPDYKAPYITNELPSRGATEVPVDSDISFDIIDTEVGVDISTLQLFVNNRIKMFTFTEISNGYHVVYDSLVDFYYKQYIEISVKVLDSSGQGNVLYDMWRFNCEGSLPPIIDTDSFYPQTCVRGFTTRVTMENFKVYDAGHGLDRNSIELIVDGNIRPIQLIPVIKRVS